MNKPVQQETLARYRKHIDDGNVLSHPQAVELLEEVERLNALINAPQLQDFWEGAKAEAAHQMERWGTSHDQYKTHSDWLALCTYLLGKAIKATWDQDKTKVLHHIMTTAAVCANWYTAAKNKQGQE